jgi:hypothetical protein
MIWRLVIVIAALLLDATSVYAQATGRMTPAEKKAFDDAALLKTCQQNIAVKRQEYDTLLSAKKYWQAAGSIRACADVWPDNKELADLVVQAEIQEHLAVIKNPRSTKDQRQQAMERLVVDYPDQGRQYEKQVKEAQHQEDAKAATYRRKQGVRIGMSQEEVVASSWGKPQSINRTTNAYGRHEQWVYDNGNYLYFDNGVLTSIQH